MVPRDCDGIAADISLSSLESAIWLGGESNSRHEDFQSSALPTELPSRLTGSGQYESPAPRRKRKIGRGHHLAFGILFWLGSGGVDLIDYPGVTSNDQFDRTATDLAVFDRRIPSCRGVHKRGEDSSTVRADHLDVFFEVHGV
jgi:hypothetical protein